MPFPAMSLVPGGVVKGATRSVPPPRPVEQPAGALGAAREQVDPGQRAQVGSVPRGLCSVSSNGYRASHALSSAFLGHERQSLDVFPLRPISCPISCRGQTEGFASSQPHASWIRLFQ